MMRLKKLSSITQHAIFSSRQIQEIKLFPSIPLQNPSQWTSNRFFDIFQMANKAAIDQERARLKDELNRGYFADIAEMKKHDGKIAMANKVIIPAVAAVKFPSIEVNYSDGSSLKLPRISENKNVGAGKMDIPKATLLCLSFRASSQAMIDSWSTPVIDAFHDSKKVQLYEVSFIDSWLLTRSPVKRLLLRMMKKSTHDEGKEGLQRQIVYSFGDHYYFRKELKILNLLTGYIFLLDKFGRVRWQGFGLATDEEVSSLLSCTSLLLKEE